MKTNEFFISPTDSASSKTYEECKTSSGLDKRYTTVVKHNNVQYNQYGVSQRRRMKRRKYNSILQFQSNTCKMGICVVIITIQYPIINHKYQDILKRIKM